MGCRWLAWARKGSLWSLAWVLSGGCTSDLPAPDVDPERRTDPPTGLDISGELCSREQPICPAGRICIDLDDDDDGAPDRTDCVLNDRLTVVVDDSPDRFVVGLPINRNLIFDGTRHWAFYSENDTFKCKVSDDFVTWTPTSTGIDLKFDLTGLNNDGRAYAVRFGRIDQKNHVFALLNRSNTHSGESFLGIRWTLGENGLDEPRRLVAGTSDKHEGITHLNAMYGEQHELGQLVGTVQNYHRSSASSVNRLIALDARSTTGLGGLNFGNIGFAENVGILFMVDGYVLLAIDNGNFGDPRVDAGAAAEANLVAPGDPFSEAIDVTDHPIGGSFIDQNYAADTSHIGQLDHVQTDDLQTWAIFITDDDTDRGNFGGITLNTRGPTRESRWINIMTDLAAAQVRHVAMATDGDLLFITYVKEGFGGPDTALYLRSYNPATARLSPEAKFADVQLAHRFERMTITSRVVDNRLLVGWSEQSLKGTYDYRAASLYVSPFRP